MISNKKGISVWVSAILYFGIGIVILTIMLTAGMPVINKMRDKNVAIQTKEVFHELDSTIREVAKEGPGSQRVTNLEIKKGKLNINDVNELIIWGFETSALLSEPGVKAKEGSIELFTDADEVAKVDIYLLTYTLNYTCKLDLKVSPSGGLSTVTGATKIVLTNGGVEETQLSECEYKRTIINIKEI